MQRLLIYSILIPVLFLTGCGKKTEKNSDGKLQIVATVGMITDLAERIGGDQVAVIGLMGPGVDPHLYRASEGDVARMTDADVIFYGGLHLEGAMTEVLEQMNRGKLTKAVTADIEESRLLTPKEFKGAHDPHVWFDVTLWMEAARTIAATLTQAEPGSRQLFETNLAALLKDLEDLHEYVKEQAERVPSDQRVLITAHDAFNYFGRAYGFEVRGLQGISTVAEAGTGDVQSLADFIVERKIRAIFVESSVPPRTIEAVQAAVRSRGFEVKIGGELFSDAMGTKGTPEGTYTGMVKHNIDTIVRALLGESAAKGEN